MKVLKKAAVGLSIVGLTLSLGACDQDNSSNDKGKTTTMAEILNDKQERKIAMTYDYGNGESPDVQWAGTIGNGKVEIYPYSNYNKDNQSFEFHEIKDENMKEYKETLKEKSKDYAEQKGKTLNIKPEKAKLIYQTNEGNNKAQSVGLFYNAKAYDDDERHLMRNKAYSVIEEDHPKNWLEIRTKDNSKKGWTQYHMLVESKNNEKNIELENLEDVEKKYDNYKILEN
ncbi:hypothetical protein [Staphylococcus hominis]|uniref:DUF5067 domain-containing protein n=1 Tax=Staphylococcus hominis TaxID=1290 RepID=A0A8X8KJF1_STAHO|nr:hypothetical protein [Staphylococcus hominis]MCM5673036.1 hypothetical protein [Staphylococcus hominis]